MSFLLKDNSSQQDELAHVKKVSDFHDSVLPVESIEPPIKPQDIESLDPMIVQSEARLHKRLWARLRGIFTHLLYLGLVK